MVKRIDDAKHPQHREERLHVGEVDVVSEKPLESSGGAQTGIGAKVCRGAEPIVSTNSIRGYQRAHTPQKKGEHSAIPVCP